MKYSGIQFSSITVLLLFLFIFSTACERKNQFQAPPPPSVTVQQPLQQMVTDYVEFNGKTEAVEYVEIRARVSGYLETIHFKPSQIVETGQLLFSIDDRPYKAALAHAKADQQSKEAELTRAQAQFELVETAFKNDAATPVEVIKARAERDAAAANVQAAKAAVIDAEINLSYTQIKSPIDGRINRHLVDVGNLVGQSEPTLLATIVKNEPIYVYFNVNEREIIDYLGNRPKAEEKNRKPTPVSLKLSDGRDYKEPGIVDFADNRVDPTTGTILVRAVFDNADDLLIPGLFVRLLLPTPEKQALLVPEQALQRDIAGYYLLIVNNENKVERRNITRGPLISGQRVIEEGVTVDDRIIVLGLQRAREGIVVNPVTSQDTQTSSSDTTNQESAS